MRRLLKPIVTFAQIRRIQCASRSWSTVLSGTGNRRISMTVCPVCMSMHEVAIENDRICRDGALVSKRSRLRLPGFRCRQQPAGEGRGLQLDGEYETGGEDRRQR
jgi:hypothetical protein